MDQCIESNNGDLSLLSILSKCIACYSVFFPVFFFFFFSSSASILPSTILRSSFCLCERTQKKTHTAQHGKKKLTRRNRKIRSRGSTLCLCSLCFKLKVNKIIVHCNVAVDDVDDVDVCCPMIISRMVHRFMLIACVCVCTDRAYLAAFLYAYAKSLLFECKQFYWVSVFSLLRYLSPSFSMVSFVCARFLSSFR